MSQQNPDFPAPASGNDPQIPDYFASDAPASPGSDAYGSHTAAPVDPYYSEPVDAPGGYSASGQSSSTKDVAKDEAANVKDTAVGAGQQVASVAKDEAKNVVAETGQQAKALLSQAASEVSSQASTQQQRIASVVHGFAKELGGMSSGESTSGALTDLASQGSQKVGEIGHWLENHEPRELVDELSAFARRRPVAFLVGALLTGVVAGRLTKGLVADAKDSTPPRAMTSGPEYTTPAPSGSMAGSQGDTYYSEPAAYPDPAAAQPATYGSTFPETGYGDAR